jgi:hypothetical protein
MVGAFGDNTLAVETEAALTTLPVEVLAATHTIVGVERRRE